MDRNAKLRRALFLAGVLVAAIVVAKLARRGRAAAASPSAQPNASAAPAASGSADAGETRALSRTPVSSASAGGLDVESGTIQGDTLWGYTELAVDLGQVELGIASAPHGAALERLLPESALAIVNGGYFERDYRPSAWLRSRGVDLAPKRDLDKGGAFAVRGERAFIGRLAEQSFDAELAVQSFPLIVEPDGSLGIHRNDGRRAARTVVCLRDGGLRFVVITAPRGEGPTLFESAPLLRAPPPAGFGCQVALNLDGGPSSGVCFGKGIAGRSRAPFAPVSYGIVLTSRQHGGH